MLHCNKYSYLLFLLVVIRLIEIAVKKGAFHVSLFLWVNLSCTQLLLTFTYTEL